MRQKTSFWRGPLYLLSHINELFLKIIMGSVLCITIIFTVPCTIRSVPMVYYCHNNNRLGFRGDQLSGFVLAGQY